MNWIEDNIVTWALGAVVTILLLSDKAATALGRWTKRLSLEEYRARKLADAHELVDREDRQEALRELAVNAEALAALAAMQPQIEAILAQVTPNHGTSMKDEVTRALEYAEHAGEAIDRLDAKLDTVISVQQNQQRQIDSIDERVTMME